MITVYGGGNVWKERMGFKEPNAGNLILLDKDGIVRWRHKGSFDEAAYKGLAAQMDSLR